MSFEETKEQQQMYNMFRSCIYIILIIEIVMNLPNKFYKAYLKKNGYAVIEE